MYLDEDVFVLTKQDKEIPADVGQTEQARLQIWNTGFKRFEQLARFPNLVELQILDYTPDGLEPFATLYELRHLRIIHFPHVHNFDPLRGLVNLEELRLETLPSWDASSKTQAVASFRPLAGLKKLHTLALAGVLAEDGDLSVLGELQALRQLWIGNLYSQEQLARLSGLLPQAKSPLLAPYLELEQSICRKCGSTKVMLSGRDLPVPRVICPSCRQNRFAETVRRFEELRRSVQQV